jgi:hypothetical protein
MAASPLVPFQRRANFEIGDWVQMVALPARTAMYASSTNRDFRRVAWIYRRCLGRRYQIIYVGPDGRPELDVSRDVAHAMGLVGCSISIEPECVVRVPFLGVLA